jgi:hypothetical protein
MDSLHNVDRSKNKLIDSSLRVFLVTRHLELNVHWADFGLRTFCKSTASNGKRPFSDERHISISRYTTLSVPLTTWSHRQHYLSQVKPWKTCFVIVYWSLESSSMSSSFISSIIQQYFGILLFILVTCRCQLDLYLLSFLQPVLGLTHSKLLHSFCGQERCTWLFVWKMYLDWYHLQLKVNIHHCPLITL